MTLQAFIIGAAKSATSSLYYNCKGHPEIALATPKETNFYKASVRRPFETYAAHWKDAAPGARVRLEASTSYTSSMRSAESAERIHADFPQARLIYIVRDPLDRVESHFNFAVQRMHWNHAGSMLQDWVLAASAYRFHLQAYERHFPREAILVLSYDALKEEPAGAMRRVAEHLGVDAEAYASPTRNLAKTLHKTRLQHLSDRLKLFRWPRLEARLQASWLHALPYLREVYPRRTLSADEALELARRFEEDVRYVVGGYGVETGHWRLWKTLDAGAAASRSPV